MRIGYTALQNASRATLVKLAKDYGIRGYSRMSWAELRAAVVAAHDAKGEGR